jgi:hypothetical protein
VLKPDSETLSLVFVLARKSLPVIIHQVQYFDFEVEFRNELNVLSASLLAIEIDEGEENVARRKFQSLFNSTIQRKDARTPIWREWGQLDWKKDLDDDERFPCPLAASRFSISSDLGRFLALTKVFIFSLYYTLCPLFCPLSSVPLFPWPCPSLCPLFLRPLPSILHPPPSAPFALRPRPSFLL